MFLAVMLSPLMEDDSEAVQQLRVLIIETTSERQVIPLHCLAQHEHAKDWMSVTYRFARDPKFGLLD